MNSLETFKSKHSNILNRVRAVHLQVSPLVFSKESQVFELHDLVHKLITCEKLLNGIELKDILSDLGILTLRVYNAYLLLLLYFRLGEFEKVLKFVESDQDRFFKDSFSKLSGKVGLKSADLENYILQIYQIHADSLMMTEQYKKANKVFYTLCKVYNKWKVKNQNT